MKPSEPIINLRHVKKTYHAAAGMFTALDGIDVQIERGEFVAVIGKSGSGKSTLLNMLAGIDTPTEGEIWVNGVGVHALSQSQLAVWRGRQVGMVFQFFQLLPTLTVLENVMLPMDFANVIPSRERKTRALQLLEEVGIGRHAHKLPSLLSGGEQQRAAIARAQANNPPIFLADEPTGNLDSQTTDAMLELFSGLAQAGKTVVMVTHERDVTAWVSRTLTLADGRWVTDVPRVHPETLREVVAHV